MKDDRPRDGSWNLTKKDGTVEAIPSQYEVKVRWDDGTTQTFGGTNPELKFVGRRVRWDGKALVVLAAPRTDPEDELTVAGDNLWKMLDELLGAGFLPEEVEDEARTKLDAWAWAKTHELEGPN